ncbi:flagellar hook-length control protein FliK [Curvibacter lanceolatus]|uniref:flagellar hook-length control protein FliK n=1 Tax=Curvibacter lanceolatus TaxID=86182 RepID=UPI0003A921DB|nr:flagellar hook-length control protein FliK [Curvibacter lanceolatus]
MVEQVKSSSTSAPASASATHARGHGKLAAGAGAGFTGLLDDFSTALADGSDASTALGADGLGDLGALLPGGQGQARRKPGVQVPGDDGDALTLGDGALPTDLVSQMALLAESARQAAAVATADTKEPATGTSAGAGLPAGVADVTKATTDPAVLAQMAAAAQKDAGAGAVSAAGPGVPGDAGRVSLESGAMARKGHRDLLAQLQAQAAGGTEVGKAALTSDTGAAGQLVPLAKADVDFKDMATRVLDNTPLAAAAEEAGKLLGRLAGADSSSSSEHKSLQAQDDRQSVSLQPLSDGQDRSQSLGVSAATPGAAGGGLNDSNARSSEEVVAEQVSYWIHQKRQAAELTLDGGNGQPVAVSISMNGNEASVAFRSDQAATRDMLNGALPELKTLLQGEGLVLAGVSVGAGNGQSDSSSSSRPGSDAASGIRRVGARASAAQDSDAPATVVRRAVSTNRTLDLFV